MAGARLSRAALVAALLSAPALAGDHYVDAVGGSDANGGTSPADAWRTLTHAVASLPPGGQTLRVAPGTYDVAHGESFPLTLKPAWTVVADPVQGEALVRGDGSGALFRLSGSLGLQGLPTHLEGLVLRGAEIGVDARPLQDFGTALRAVGVRFEGLSTVAVRSWSDSLVGSYVEASVDLDRVVVRDCGGAVEARAYAADDTQAVYSVTCTSCVFVDNGYGLYGNSDPTQGEDSGGLTLEGCRLEGNGGTAVAVIDGGVLVEECLLVGNGTGVSASYGGGGVVASTLVGNGTGISSMDSNTQVVDSIVYGNDDDLFDYGFQVRFSNIGDGDYFGVNGNLSTDPLFWAPEFADYHLRAGSPCIDSGDPNEPLDPDGSRGDMGAFVFDAGYAPAPLRYCEGGLNSLGRRARLSSSGSLSQAANEFTLEAASCPPGVSAIFFYGGDRAEAPLGGGTRCVAAGATGLFRLGPPLVADGAGRASRLLDFTAAPAGAGPGAIGPGESRHFQLWYRDPAAAPADVNLSDGLTVWFLP